MRGSLVMAAALSLVSLSSRWARADGFEAQLATGVSFGFQNRNEYGTGSFSRIYPEILVYGYLGGFAGPVWFRPGLRLAYASEQAEMPQSLRVEERDFSGAAEVGVLYDWYVIPSFALGGGIISRKIELVTEGAASSAGDSVGASETLPFIHAQLGVGIPLWQGFVVVEPYYRYASVQKDARITSSYGLELTFRVL